MKKTLILNMLVMSTLTIAQPSLAHEQAKAATAWTAEAWNRTLDNMPIGDASKGKILHRTALCMTCHGDKGIAPSRNTPNLAGNTVEYNYKTMMDYKSGLRFEGGGKSALMVAATQSLTQQKIADLSAYYAESTPTSKETTSETSPAILKLIRKGEVSRMIVPCASCHGAHGEGNGITPALAGQTTDYFIRTMKAYKHSHRTNDINEGMSQFTHDLTDQEIEALANYYATLQK